MTNQLASAEARLVPEGVEIDRKLKLSRTDIIDFALHEFQRKLEAEV